MTQLAVSPENIQPSHEPTTREELLLLAVERFVNTGDLNRLSVDQFKEAFYLLIDKVTSPCSQQVSRQLAQCPFAPRSTILYLAFETLAIATPVLSNSPVLGQLDLQQIVAKKNEHYAEVVASRPDIGPSLISTLKSLGCDAVDAALENNEAISTLVDKKSQAKALFERIETSLNEQTTVSQGVAELNTVASPSGQDLLLAAANRGNRLLEKPIVKTALQSIASFDFGKALEQASLARSRPAMGALIQKRFGITMDTALEVLEDKTGDTLCVLMSAANIDAARANRILILTLPTIGLSVQNAMRSVRFFARLNPQSSAQAVDQWPRDAQAVVHETVLSQEVSRRDDIRETPDHSVHGSGAFRQTG